MRRLIWIAASVVAFALAGGTVRAVVLEENDASAPEASGEPQVPVRQVAPSGGVYVPDIGTLVPELRNVVPDVPLPREEQPVVTEPPPTKKVLRPRYDNKTQAAINNAKARTYLVGKADPSGKKGPVPCNTINIGTIGDGLGSQTSSSVSTGNVSSVTSGCK